MKVFANHFREEVIPRLQRRANAEAWAVVLGHESWSGAWDTVMDHARQRGALYLPADKLDALEDWISTTLSTEIEKVERDLAG